MPPIIKRAAVRLKIIFFRLRGGPPKSLINFLALDSKACWFDDGVIGRGRGLGSSVNWGGVAGEVEGGGGGVERGELTSEKGRG